MSKSLVTIFEKKLTDSEMPIQSVPAPSGLVSWYISKKVGLSINRFEGSAEKCIFVDAINISIFSSND